MWRKILLITTLLLAPSQIQSQGLNAQTKTEVKASIELNKPTAGDNQITGYSGDEMTSFSRLHQIQALPLSLSEKNVEQISSPNPSISKNFILGGTAIFLTIVLIIGALKFVLRRKSKQMNETDSVLTQKASKLDQFSDENQPENENDYQVQNHPKIKIINEVEHDSDYYLDKFDEGRVEGINPELSLDEQADLLPYDQKFEFPREKLQLGKQLGTGAFGVVFKATANGMIAHEVETIVAVKMVKGIAGYEVMRALVLELKIMIHLGRHLNVVNLLGAVTKNIAKRELMVVVEYCPHGNLQSFLVKHRKHFVDQIVRDRDIIDPTIEQNQSASTGYVLKSVRTVTTTDLLSWSFQIARGMDYLASRKVLHGDLAARNILLCDDNVVKICDFGLARSMYKTGNYHITTQRALPFKWLALESITDQIFSTSSDVWSFGIVLWELFSLGASPYPGMIAGVELFEKLKEGYRMDKPDYATQEIYEIMLSCWQTIPESRSLFDKLEDRISKILDKGVSDHYVSLNEPYLSSNANYSKPKDVDYLALLGIPNIQAPSLPTVR